ncbi:glycine/D-amino acid oxidase, deaminating [SAR116 cluster alpha proteobacterium HIMB100]|nr:glycine/D-amino acid oxidase, deaminating [SAR116 cluster alpha proteobacterium HIMB100]
MFLCQKVARLPVDPGPAAWNDILGPGRAYPQAEGNICADWLVIGGGFAGLAAAKRLLELRGGDKIVLLEATKIAAGPAGRNSGFMIDLPHELGADSYAASQEFDRKQITLNRHAQAFVQTCFEQYEMPAEAVRSIGRINGAVNARGEAHNADYARHLDALDESFTVMSAADMSKMTGSDYYRSGLFLPGAVMLQPALYIRSLAEGIATKEKTGVQIFEQSPAISFEQQQDSWCVRTPSARIAAKNIILAVNGHAESFGFFKGRLMHIFTYASMTEPLSAEQSRRLGGEANWGITPSDPMGSTIRRHDGYGGNRLVIRNRWTYNPSMTTSNEQIKAFGRDQDKAFIRRFPMLTDVKMAYRWSGRLCLSRNSSPAFGEVAPSLYSACCQNGLGTAKGTLSGIGAVELATRSNSEIVTDLQSYPLPQKLPPAPVANIGANLVLKWRELKAGREI